MKSPEKLKVCLLKIISFEAKKVDLPKIYPIHKHSIIPNLNLNFPYISPHSWILYPRVEPLTHCTLYKLELIASSCLHSGILILLSWQRWIGQQWSVLTGKRKDKKFFVQIYTNMFPDYPLNSKFYVVCSLFFRLVCLKYKSCALPRLYLHLKT